jgi:HPt (histidine-containing phosphotransfer) domain-containing protein
MDGYISKPVRAAELSRIVAQFAPGQRPSSSSAKPSELAVDTIADSGIDEPPRARPAVDMDWTVALQNVGGDHDLLRSVAIAALDEWPLFIDQLRTSIANHDQATLHRIAHTFKGAFRTLGAEEAYTLADRLESAANTDGLASFPLPELFEAIESVTVQLTTFVGKPQSV